MYELGVFSFGLLWFYCWFLFFLTTLLDFSQKVSPCGLMVWIIFRVLWHISSQINGGNVIMWPNRSIITYSCTSCICKHLICVKKYKACIDKCDSLQADTGNRYVYVYLCIACLPFPECGITNLENGKNKKKISHFLKNDKILKHQYIVNSVPFSLQSSGSALGDFSSLKEKHCWDS